MADVTYNIEINSVTDKEAVPPFFKGDGEIDQAAMTEYDEFIINLFAVLYGNGYEIVDEETGPRGDTDYCITAFKKSELTTENVKCILFVSVSGHYSPEEFKTARLKSMYSKLTWGVQNVTVNGDIFGSYDEALEGIDKKLSQGETNE